MCDCCGNHGSKSGPTMIIIPPKKTAAPKDEPEPEKK